MKNAIDSQSHANYKYCTYNENPNAVRLILNRSRYYIYVDIKLSIQLVLKYTDLLRLLKRTQAQLLYFFFLINSPPSLRL